MEGKRILVTGGAGFLGSHFVRHALAAGGARVINLDLLTYAGDLRRLADVEDDKRYAFVRADVASEDEIRGVFAEYKPEIVVHYAAESHVTRSENAPDLFNRTNVEGTRSVLDAAAAGAVERIIHVSCYDDKTRALTREGFKQYWEIEEGDLVLSLNPTTGVIEEKKITKVIVQDYEGSMVHFCNSRVNLLVTPNHRMLCNTKSRKLKIETAVEVAQRSVAYLPHGIWQGRDEPSTSVPGVGTVSTEDLFYVCGLFIGDGFVSPQEKVFPNKSGWRRPEYLARSKDPVTGRFRTVEEQGPHPETVSHSWRIFFDIPENDKARPGAEAALRALGIRFHAHNGNAGEHLYFSSRVWSRFFEQFGRYARNKRVPPWMFGYAPRYLERLLKGLMDSDGSQDIQYTTVSDRLLADVCQLAFQLGIQPRWVVHENQSVLKGRTISGKAYYLYLSRQKTSVGISRSNASLVPYRGKVWCVSVEDNRNLIVERDGKLAFCGNTDEVYGPIEEGSFQEEDKRPGDVQATSAYAKSKALADDLALTYADRLPVIVARPTNAFGPHQFPEKAFARWVTRAVRGEPILVWGDGLYIRQWLYADDFARAIALLATGGDPGAAYNVGPEHSPEITNLALAQWLASHLGLPESRIELTAYDRPDHDRRYAVSSAKVRALGWAPGEVWSQFASAAEWYKANREWWEPHVAEAESIYTDAPG